MHELQVPGSRAALLYHLRLYLITQCYLIPHHTRFYLDIRHHI